MSIERAKQIALFTAMAAATVYKFLEEIDTPKVGIISGGGTGRVSRGGRR